MPSTARQALDEAVARNGGSFDRLVSIDIRHDYCNLAEGRFDGISLVPSRVTAERLSRYGLLARHRSDGIDLFHSQAHAAALHDFLKALPDEVRRNPPVDLFGPPLLFVMHLRDQLFFNFTEAPTNVGEGRPALLLGNSRIHKIEGQSAEFDISWEDAWGIAQARSPEELAKPVKPKTVEPPPSDLSTAARERFADTLATVETATQADRGRESYQGWWLESRGEMASARSEQASLQFRARRLPFGLIKIYMFAAGERGSSDSWDGYPIDLQGKYDPEGEGGGLIRPARYIVRFPARATYWRYLIAGRNDLDHSALAISDQERPGPFAVAGSRMLPDGRQASCFEAIEPLPLRKRPVSTFTLTSSLKGASDWQKVQTQLPAASAESVLPDPHPPPGRCWSDIYVFV